MLAPALLAGAFSACSHDSFSDILEAASTNPQMNITIAMSGSRADDSGMTFEEGEGLENYLNISGKDKYRIYFFDADNKYFSSFNTLVYTYIGSDDGKTYYRFQGEAPADLPEKFKIVTLFNWPEYPVEMSSGSAEGGYVLIPGTTTIEDLCTGTHAQFNHLANPADGEWLDISEGRLIPFYGVREYDINDYIKTTDWVTTEDGDKEIKGGIVVDLTKNPLPLLRAMAKVEVILNDANLDFERVELVNVNPKGYCSPKNATTHDSYYNGYNWDTDFIHNVHLPWKDGDKDVNASSAESIGSLLMTRKNPTEKKWIAYIPEYINKDVADGTECKIKVILSQGSISNDEWAAVSSEKKAQYIYFSPEGKKSGTDTYDIWRNNIYRFTLSAMNFKMEAKAEIQPFAEQVLNFGFGLMRDSRGDLMIIPTPERDEAGNVVVDENGETVYSYPQYFLDFINDDNPNHKFPQEEDENGNHTTGKRIRLEEGDYYAIVVGEYEAMSDAVLWVKDRTGCHVLSNFGTVDDGEDCNARLVESFFGNNQSEKFYKDKFGYRRVHHFENHNSIVIDPEDDGLLFCVIENFGQISQFRKYYEVESWDAATSTGWIINKDADGNETGFQEIKTDGTIGKAVDLDGNLIQ